MAAPLLPAKWNWQVAIVDRQREHVEIRYGDARVSSFEKWMPVGLVGRPSGYTFPVQWLLEPSAHPVIYSEVLQELDFYLAKHPLDYPDTGDPWSYVIYHCGTSANIYSPVHWSYFDGRDSS